MRWGAALTADLSGCAAWLLGRTASRAAARSSSVCWGRAAKVADPMSMTSLSIKVWALRLLIAAGIVLLSVMTGSSAPPLALLFVWAPMGLVHILFERGALRLPRFLEPVGRIEPVLYHWLGVGLVKRIVTTRMWPLVNGFDPPERLKAGPDVLDRAE